MGNETTKEKDDIMLSKDYKYKYKNRRCMYRYEMLEISPEEQKTINILLENAKSKVESKEEQCNPYQQLLNITSKRPIKIIIDTDIGTDIDDVLALLQLIHMPENDVECLGITTNYRPTLLRKHIVERIFQECKDKKWSKVTVVAGNCHLCGTHRPFYYAGNEGNGLGLSKSEQAQLWNTVENSKAEDFIYETIKKYPKEVTIVSIGIPTNIGNCINKYGKKEFESLVGHLMVMGGGSIIDQRSKVNGCIGKYVSKESHWRHRGNITTEELNEIKHPFELPSLIVKALNWCKNYDYDKVVHFFPNHNISGDTLASQMLFECKCPISVIPHHITRKNILKGKAIETLLHISTKCKTTVGKTKYIEYENGICACLMREWFRVRRGQRLQCLHDPLTLYEAVYPIFENESKKKEESKEDEPKFEVGKSCLKYCYGTFLIHEWAAFMTFVPNKNGPHRFAYECRNPSKFIEWCGNTLINNVSEENKTDDAGDYRKIMAKGKVNKTYV